jgi:hypothetical protein
MISSKLLIFWWLIFFVQLFGLGERAIQRRSGQRTVLKKEEKVSQKREQILGFASVALLACTFDSVILML